MEQFGTPNIGNFLSVAVFKHMALTCYGSGKIYRIQYQCIISVQE